MMKKLFLLYYSHHLTTTNEDGSHDSDKYHLHSESAQQIVNLGEDNTKFRNHLASIIAK
jgi:hypothetical protein